MSVGEPNSDPGACSLYPLSCPPPPGLFSYSLNWGKLNLKPDYALWSSEDVFYVIKKKKSRFISIRINAFDSDPVK
jgi:hypothetical protein